MDGEERRRVSCTPTSWGMVEVPVAVVQREVVLQHESGVAPDAAGPTGNVRERLV